MWIAFCRLNHISLFSHLFQLKNGWQQHNLPKNKLRFLSKRIRPLQETGTKSSKLSRISQKNIRFRESKETELCSRYTTISFKLPHKELSASSRENSKLWTLMKPKDSKFMCTTKSFSPSLLIYLMDLGEIWPQATTIQVSLKRTTTCLDWELSKLLTLKDFMFLQLASSTTEDKESLLKALSLVSWTTMIFPHWLSTVQ